MYADSGECELDKYVKSMLCLYFCTVFKRILLKLFWVAEALADVLNRFGAIKYNQIQRKQNLIYNSDFIDL